jgi:hypothetical protein
VVEVIATDEWLAWYDGLDEQADDVMTAAVDTLRVMGVGLRAPLSSAINGSRYALRELRTQAGGRPLRTFYIFDFERAAVLLIGGDKTGDEGFYDRMIPIAERIWEQYKRERGSK